MPRVVVIGGGVAGLTAAHELAERGFEVHIVEKRTFVGGKAASVLGPCTVNPVSLPALPLGAKLHGEHGFRFFPSFYLHLFDTMARTPLWDRQAASADPDADQVYRSAADNLVSCYVEALAFDDGQDVIPLPRTAPQSIQAVLQLVRTVLRRGNFTLRDLAQYQLKIFELLSSCPARRQAEYEAVSWWDFVHGKSGVGLTSPPLTYSPAFDQYLDAAPQLLVAMDAHQGAARAQGEILIQLLLNEASTDGPTDQVLNGPSSDQWLRPWQAHLQRQGVTFHTGEIDHFDLVGGAPQPAWSVAPPGLPPAATTDYYVLAIPMADAYTLLFGAPAGIPAGSPAVVAADPTLLPFGALVPAASTAWLSGIQFYLRDDVELLRGHLALADSPWALSAVSQAQFWGDDFAQRYGLGQVRTTLSVDIARWTVPGVSTPAANQCTPAELAGEVWRQLQAGIVTSRFRLPDWPPGALAPPPLVAGYHIDDNLQFPGGSPPVQNLTPMFINGPGSWPSRPGPLEPGYLVHLGKLVLAGDYTQTYTGLPCMEGANESARHAVNAILGDAEARQTPPHGQPYELCAIWPLDAREPGDVAFFKELDQKLFAMGVPNIVQTLGWEQLVQALPDDIPSSAPAVDVLAGLLGALYPLLQLI